MADILKQLLASEIRPLHEGHVPFLLLEKCLMDAFDIPLYHARDIEGWTEFSAAGDLDDEKLNALFQPWMEAFKLQSK
ncbi:hypothetical protein [Deinococcus roseus]|uniref:Uncharacterized protein n=1 Tax=Deinococcus roseus TaxID=392414 RepID=A0ABQ2CXP8_9DEIO|nr:hypothetical protein [Deinococcus roseus]GGJ26420.1 hypothetical protein GCM10008938_10770 [Deinococcus roseus]